MVYTSMCVGTCDFVYLVWTILIGSDGYLEAVAPSESGYHGVDVDRVNRMTVVYHSTGK